MEEGKSEVIAAFPSPRHHSTSSFSFCAHFVHRWLNLVWIACNGTAGGQDSGMTDGDDRYQKGDMPWDKGLAAPPLLELLDLLGAEAWGSGPVMVPGCGLGHDVRALAGRGIPAVGVDISPTAVARARELPLAGGEIYET